MKYKIYEYNDETLIVIIDKNILIDDLNYLKDSLNEDYIVLLRAPNDVNENMNLIRLSD